MHARADILRLKHSVACEKYFLAEHEWALPSAVAGQCTVSIPYVVSMCFTVNTLYTLPNVFWLDEIKDMNHGACTVLDGDNKDELALFPSLLHLQFLIACSMP